jgi:hypothetical protein
LLRAEIGRSVRLLGDREAIACGVRTVCASLSDK